MCYGRFSKIVRLTNQELHNDSFYRPLVSFIHCIFGTESYLDASLTLNYEQDKHCQGCGQIVSCFRNLMKDDIFLPFLTKQVFITTNVILAAPNIDEINDNIGCSLFVFDI